MDDMNLEDLMELAALNYGFFDYSKDEMVRQILFEGRTEEEIKNPICFVDGKYVNVKEIVKESKLYLFKAVVK